MRVDPSKSPCACPAGARRCRCSPVTVEPVPGLAGARRCSPVTVEPVLAGDRLLVADSTGRVSALSPYDGAILGSIKVGAPVFLPPVVVDQTVLVLEDDGTLTAYR